MKSFVRRAAALVLASLAAPLAAAPQIFPARPITIVVPDAPGGKADALARILAPELSKVWKQPVAVENVPGDGGRTAAWRVARSPWDAYTLLLAPTATIDDPRKHYFASVSVVATSPLVLLAGAGSRIADVAGLVKLAKAKPGGLAYGAVGAAGATGLAGELFKSMAGVDLRRVEFGTGGEAIAGLAAGRVDVAFVPVNEAMAQIAGGAVKALAVTGAVRAGALPKVPTVAESGVPGYEAVTWYGLMLPIATPTPFVAIHNADANKVLAAPDVREKIRAEGVEPAGGPYGRLFELIRMDQEQWSKLARPAAAKP